MEPLNNALSVKLITRFQLFSQARAILRNAWKQEPSLSQAAKSMNFFRLKNSNAKSATQPILFNLFMKHKQSFLKNAFQMKTLYLNVWGIFRLDSHAHMIVTVAAQNLSWLL
jgi:uncharacterized NAD(P)/FAD-binding protein YdhS